MKYLTLIFLIFANTNYAVSQSATENKTILQNVVFVEGGSFSMGTENGDPDEIPVHNVQITSFYMCRYEVTNKEFVEFLNTYGSEVVINGQYAGQSLFIEAKTGIFNENGSWQVSQNLESFPVVDITWYGANEFCTYYGYRLPTEAEWEYAAGGGKLDSIKTIYSGSNSIDEVAWHWDNSDKRAHYIGTKKANSLGIYDLCGNVYEWCADWYNETYYTKSPKKDPQGSQTGEYKVIRGGSWYVSEEFLRIQNRSKSRPDKNYPYLGFRYVIDVKK